MTDLGRRRATELEGTADEWWPGGESLDGWINVFMSSRPFGWFHRCIGYCPPIFL